MKQKMTHHQLDDDGAEEWQRILFFILVAPAGIVVFLFCLVCVIPVSIAHWTFEAVRRKQIW
jgi:hypothetical protein